MPPLTAILLALIAGMSNVFAFAPFGWWPLQIATLALLFYLLTQHTTFKQSCLTGWAFGTGWLVSGVYWLYISMHVYGGMPSAMAAIAVFLLAAFLGLLVAGAAGLASWIRTRWQLSLPLYLLLVLPAVWVLAEWTRGWIFTGFPWVVSGYAHTASPLAGFAPVIGVYGIGWLAALVAASLVLLPRCKKIMALPVLLLIAGLGLQHIDWTQPHGTPVSVRLLQGNVPQEIKFDAHQANLTLRQYEDMIRAMPADLIATPETALPLLLHQLPTDYLPRLASYATASNSHLAIGVPVSDDPVSYANSVIGISPTSTDTTPSLYRYDKHHLVPFGEFIPFGFRWFVNMMHIPLGDFTRGSKTPLPFAVKDQWVLPNICYEDLFGEEIADQLRASRSNGTPEASMLLNLSNIAWFGDSVALPQHLQISQMRALETGRPMLRATNTGATAIIGPKGSITAELAPFTLGVLTASVQGYRGATPYIVLGNSLIVGIAALLLLGAILLGRRRRHS
ncbi:MAG: apolipoprotein N-acyltransferase [Oxalicibacterium faecigallinarum]|uniref:apolipoprotein N-acyltransferase n=1 Tax=Oxalicibacterium faecigallinarum TaxID=573741 RepID=UPI00280A3FCC|nr:apolipoprotein N-acyltransferase [Oxalicibacterium faecigallinarum]MDQ7970581.1 apolipoprotein N-acyltransferase [Oxalicibacterium faecigallinarum]